jgi:hypothetical protein
LLLKGLWNRRAWPAFLEAFGSLREGYLSRVDWEAAEAVEARAAALLPGLLLARIDGKSPVEYVTDEGDRNLARSVALPFLANPPDRLGAVVDAWRAALQNDSGSRNG